MVITSALHAEGREFDPRPEYSFKTCQKSVFDAGLRTTRMSFRRFPQDESILGWVYYCYYISSYMQ